ncbi:MAG: hypothetical protein ABIJ23_02905 [Candidatus Magasanikbacteria bacterium]
MNWIKHKKLFSSTIVLLIGIGLLFCCGASFQAIAGDNSEHAGCGMADMTHSSDSSQSQHNYMIVTSFAKMLDNFILILSVLSVLSVITFYAIVRYCDFKFYLKNIRDKYGGFNLFNYLLRLFGLGILHPKTF